MTHKSANSNSTNDSSRLAQSGAKGAARCAHRTPAGRRCRLRVVDAPSGLCFRHPQLRHQHLEVADLAPDLVGELLEFTSAAQINQVLSRLLILLPQNRISPRRAAVIAYISNLLLRTLPAIDQELHPEPDQDTADPVIICDVPRPDSGEHVGQTR